jgi:gluconate 2-dehydrogenase gamma chain
MNPTEGAMLDRRELIQRVAVMLGGAVSASAVAGVMSGLAATPASAQAARFFTSDEARTVAVLAEQIIPRTDSPGAIDAGVPAFIDRMMAEFYQDRERQALRAGLARVDRDAQTAHGKAFAALTSDQQVALMTVYDREAYEQRAGAQRHFFRTLKELTTLGFFGSQVGATQALKYNINPGPYRGDIPFSEVGRAWAL